MIRQFRSLFEAGTVAGLTDAQLIERFLGRRDEAGELAFAALVARHGPMVLGVCRRALADPNDAADAFQATFLILVRKAHSIRIDDSLGRWLYGVSRRVAARARLEAARRPRSIADDLPARAIDPDRFELSGIIDEELARLPQVYRSAVILCDLGGLTHEEAARDLACPVGTIKSRLARGRQQLRGRLERRGLAATLPNLAPPYLPASLAEAVVRSSWLAIHAGSSLAGLAPASAIALTQGVLKSMNGFHLKLIATATLSLGVVVTGAGVLAQGKPEPGEKSAVATAPLPAQADPDRPDKSSGFEEALRFFPPDHWVRSQDVKFRFHDVKGGYYIFARNHQQLDDGKRLALWPFALIWLTAGEQRCQMVVGDSAIIDMNPPFGSFSKSKRAAKAQANPDQRLCRDHG